VERSILFMVRSSAHRYGRFFRGLATNKNSGEHLMTLTSKTKTALAAGLTALTLGAAAPAEARPFGGFHGGYRGFHGGFYRPAFYGG